jgi:subtilisin family serine protease
MVTRDKTLRSDRAIIGFPGQKKAKYSIIQQKNRQCKCYLTSTLHKGLFAVLSFLIYNVGDYLDIVKVGTNLVSLQKLGDRGK